MEESPTNHPVQEPSKRTYSIVDIFLFFPTSVPCRKLIWSYPHFNWYSQILFTRHIPLDKMVKQINLYPGGWSCRNVLAGFCLFNHVKCFSLALRWAWPKAALASHNPNEKPLRVKWLSFTEAKGGLEPGCFWSVGRNEDMVCWFTDKLFLSSAQAIGSCVLLIVDLWFI